MKKISLFILIGAVLSLVSCGGNTADQPATAAGFTEIQNEIKSEFGEDAYFTDISIVYDKTIGNIVGVTVTTDPSSLKMGQWNLSQGSWTQNSDISLEVPEGTQAADFMYQLNDQINLTQLGSLIEKSKQQLKDEKDLENPTLYTASVIFPKNGDIARTEYAINLKPENGGTTFRFYYALDGSLRKMDY
ncbi:MAG: hypothetical protein ACSHWW_12775 [Nonlabens sp.]|uniref:hypothetical protein n=1 Tax=Nonlabens sp. TaxID=1888209 RepID=UPI003EF4C37D